MFAILFVFQISSISDKPDWSQLRFANWSRNETRITKIEIEIKRNEEVFSIIKPFEKNDTELIGVVISDPKKLSSIEESFSSILRLQLQSAGSYTKMGTITIHTSDSKQIEIGICSPGFTLGNKPPTSKNIFFNWALAKAVDQAARDKFKTGLNSKLFKILSGQYWIDANSKTYRDANK